MLERYGEETWFRLGDRDLATHVVRTARLRRGDRPTDVARDLQRALGVRARILPMTDAPVRTEVLTDEGWLEFQEYFVHRHQEPAVRDVRFIGIEEARVHPGGGRRARGRRGDRHRPVEPVRLGSARSWPLPASKPGSRRPAAAACPSSPSRESSAATR